MSTFIEFEGSDGDDLAAQITSVAEKINLAIQKTTSSAEIRALLEELQIRTDLLCEEHERERGIKGGFETLTPNRRGGRSRQWFEETGNYFSLGYAAMDCLVVGIVHEDIGIAGSNRSMITIDEMLEKIQIAKVTQSLDLPLSDMSSSLGQRRFLLQTITQTATEAVEEFAALAKGQAPQTPLQVFMYGMSTSPRDILPVYESLIIDTLRIHPALEDFIGNPAISALGYARVLAYGGKNHPQFPTPTLF